MKGRSLMFSLSEWQLDYHWGEYFLFVSLGWFSIAYFRFDAERMFSRAVIHASGMENLMNSTDNDDELYPGRMIRLLKEGIRRYVDATPGEGIEIYAHKQFEGEDE